MVDYWNLIVGVGRGPFELSAFQTAARAIIIYVAVIIVVRLGKKRFMGRATPFDVIVGIVIGSIGSRAITGNAPLVPAIASAATIMAVHWLFSFVALRSHRFGCLIKGYPRLVIQDGEIDRAMLRKAHMTEHDLAEALRMHGLPDAQDVAEGRIERNGALSVIRRE